MPLLATRDTSLPANGVFFVVPLPHGWQLCTFREDDFGSVSLPDCWPHALISMLNFWLRHFEDTGAAGYDKIHDVIDRKLAFLIANCDALPRGRVRRGVRQRHFIVRHGGEITAEMNLPIREVEAAFGITEPARWMEDEELKSDRESAEFLRECLPIKQRWESAIDPEEEPA